MALPDHPSYCRACDPRRTLAPAATIETIALANGDASYKYNLTVPFVTSSNTTPGPKYVSVPSTVSSSDISTYQTNLDAFNSGLPWQDTKDTSSYDSFKTVGKNALDLMPSEWRLD